MILRSRRVSVAVLGVCASSILGMMLFIGDITANAQNASALLQLTLQADKAKFVLGEPVYLTIRLRNTGTTTLTVYKQLRPEEGMVHIEITAPDGRGIGFAPLTMLDVDTPIEDLGRGAEVSAVFPVFYGANGWTFRQPGDYTLQAVYHAGAQNKTDALRSNSLTITITPGGAAGEFLFELEEASHEAGKFLLWQSGDHLRKGIARLESLLDQFPDSLLADYVQLALGINLSRSFTNYAAKSVRPPDYGAALAHLQKVRENQLPSYLKVQRRLAQARCYVRLGKHREARVLLRQTRSLIGERSEFRVFLKQLDRLDRVVK